MATCISFMKKVYFIPISALKGDNVVNPSEHTPWYKGETLLHLLEQIPLKEGLEKQPFRFPVGTYVKTDKYDHIMMAMKTTMTAEGAKFEVPAGTAEENAKLDQSYEHLCKMRDELVTLNIVPPIAEWSKINPNL